MSVLDKLDRVGAPRLSRVLINLMGAQYDAAIVVAAEPERLDSAPTVALSVHCTEALRVRSFSILPSNNTTTTLYYLKMIGSRTLVLAAVAASALTATTSATTVSTVACTQAQRDSTLQLTTYGYPYASQCQEGTGWMFYPDYIMPTRAQWSKICKAESCGMLAWLTKSSTANCVMDKQFNLYTYVDAYEKKCNRTVTNDPKSVGYKG